MKNVVFYNTNDIIDKIQYLLNNPQIIKQISDDGFGFSSKHTYKKRVAKLMEFIKTI
jgi:spore maturation protein CgeB